MGAGSTGLVQKSPNSKSTFKSISLCKYKSYKGIISIDHKPKQPRFVLCKKPQQKTSIQQEITVFPKQSKNCHFLPNSLGNLFENLSILKSTFKGSKNFKCKSYKRVIGIDQKPKRPGFLLCKKPQQKISNPTTNNSFF